MDQGLRPRAQSETPTEGLAHAGGCQAALQTVTREEYLMTSAGAHHILGRGWGGVLTNQQSGHTTHSRLHTQTEGSSGKDKRVTSSLLTSVFYDEHVFLQKFK